MNFPTIIALEEKNATAAEWELGGYVIHEYADIIFGAYAPTSTTWDAFYVRREHEWLKVRSKLGAIIWVATRRDEPKEDAPMEEHQAYLWQSMIRTVWTKYVTDHLYRVRDRGYFQDDEWGQILDGAQISQSVSSNARELADDASSELAVELREQQKALGY